MKWLNALFQPKKKRIYLDYAAATPILPEVRKAVAKYFLADFYNPSAIYEEGVRVKREIEEHRKSVAKLIGAAKEEVIFTSGGTEADNLAVLGVAEACLEHTRKPHVIVSAIEHPAVMQAAHEVVRRGGEMSVAPVDEEGVVSVESIKKLIKKNTVLISVCLANSEIGTVEPVAKIGRLVREERKMRQASYPLLHTDASAAASYVPILMESLQCDLLTLDGAKIYGPKGVGILALRRGVELHPIIFGGSQERGRRAGTPNAGLIAGFAAALELAARDRDGELGRLEAMRQRFSTHIVKSLPEAIINGSSSDHLPNIVSVSIPGIIAEFIVLSLDAHGIAASVGTACSLDERTSGSPVIRALGKDTLAESTVRFSFGRYTTENEAEEAAKIFCREAKNLIK